MSCYRLFGAYRTKSGDLFFGSGNDARADGEYLRLPCGYCFGCRMEAAKMWSIRCEHEASCWDHNVFVTLTYDDKHLDWRRSLDRRHVQLFLKKLRKSMSGVQVAPDGRAVRPIRFFGCGEYGSRTDRPHYHLLLFNTRFGEKEKYGKDTYVSPVVSKLWEFGTHLIGDVTPASAKYVAGYSMKKVSGRVAREAKYEVVNPETGECFQRVPEFSMASLKPGIGQYWFDRYKGDLRNGYLVHDGTKVPIPRFYEQKFCASLDPVDLEDRQFLRDRRRFARTKSDPDRLSDVRLEASELIARARKRLYGRVSEFEEV